MSTEQANDVICQTANFASSISENCGSVQTQVKEVALRLLPIIQGEGNVSAVLTTAAPQGQVLDMLGELSMSSTTASVSSSQPSAFGFLDADPAPAVQNVQRTNAPVRATPSSFDFLSDPAQNLQAAPSATAFNFLDANTAEIQAAPASSAFNFLDDSSAPAASPSAFSFLSDATSAPAPAPAPLGVGSGILNKGTSFKAAPAGQTELEKMLANSSGYLPSMTARPASNAFDMAFGYGQAQQPMQNAYMQQPMHNAYMQQPMHNANMQQQQFSTVVCPSFVLFLIFNNYFPQPVMQPTFDFVEDAMMKKKREGSK